MLNRERIALQKGMNFRVRGGAAGYSIILMSVRKGAPYQDQWHDSGPHAGLLEYEGHDVPRPRDRRVDPKRVDQPMYLPGGKSTGGRGFAAQAASGTGGPAASGTGEEHRPPRAAVGGTGEQAAGRRLTENGKFYAAAMAAAAGEAPPEVVQVYEKIADGIWCDRGRHELVDAEVREVAVTPRAKRTRKVFRFYLRPAATPGARTREDERELTISRLIPTGVKVEVWRRDGGRCVECGATDNLHFDHDVPFSKGGSSITAANVKLLCARHNLSKSDRIVSLGPLLGPLVAGAIAGMVRGA
jgi:hypothetical protein